MSLLEIALREGNYELAALVIVCGMIKVIHIVYNSLIMTRYKQLLNPRDKPFLFKGKFGNRPVSPTIEL